MKNGLDPYWTVSQDWAGGENQLFLHEKMTFRKPVMLGFLDF
jgi:hypothetical protein